MERTAFKDFWRFIYSLSDEDYNGTIKIIDFMRNSTEEEIDTIIKQGIESGAYTDENEADLRAVLNTIM